ncbi:MAG: hypothetical protein QM535_01255 [Limnohabitans sp.]|nr:hypothetical protein [Limnohabitans sp.]
MKKLLIIIFLFQSFFPVAQRKEIKKIKEEFIVQLNKNQAADSIYKEYNSNGEILSEGNWIFKNNAYKKTNIKKVLSDTELNIQIIKDKEGNIISKTEYFTDKDYQRNLQGLILRYEIMLYNQKNLFKKYVYHSQVDTTDAGREELNYIRTSGDEIAYKKGYKKLNKKFIKYYLKKTSEEEYDENNKLFHYLDLFDRKAYEYIYDDHGNQIGYYLYEEKPRRDNYFLSWFENNFEDTIFDKENLKDEYSIKYQYDEFGNWIIQNVYSKSGELFEKTEKHLVYI